jgi:hypothetical protein
VRLLPLTRVFIAGRTPRYGDSVVKKEYGGLFVNPLAIFMQLLAGIGAAVAIVSAVVVVMKNSKES